jgi:exosome complex component CSL4
MQDQAIATPGTRIGHTETQIGGKGTYTRDDRIYASVTGTIKITTDTDKKELVEVIAPHTKETLVPQINSIVLAQIIKTTPQFAKVDILCVEGKALETTFPGLIRQQDVRATEIDKVIIYESFRPGDVVRASVISLGDSRSYYLSTARNELGVVFATSMSGAPMIPVSWKEMQCTKTSLREPRKVAKTV